MNDEEPTIERVIDQLRRLQSDTNGVLESLENDRRQIELNAAQLEGPSAALDYIDFFAGFFTHVSKECGRVAGELPEELGRPHLDILRQMANNAAAEERRCLQFRDKWINKPLAWETMRPLLNTISLVTRDQLVAFRALNDLATELEKLAPAQDVRDESKTLDRRALLTRLFKPPDGAS